MILACTFYCIQFYNNSWTNVIFYSTLVCFVFVIYKSYFQKFVWWSHMRPELSSLAENIPTLTFFILKRMTIAFQSSFLLESSVYIKCRVFKVFNKHSKAEKWPRSLNTLAYDWSTKMPFRYGNAIVRLCVIIRPSCNKELLIDMYGLCNSKITTKGYKYLRP